MAKSSENDNIKKLLLDLLGSRPVAYYPVLARRVGGVKAAVMLCQIMYWRNSKNVIERGGWLYKSAAEMEEETGLTPLEQQSARRVLMGAGVIEAKLKGVPRTWQYKFNEQALIDIIARDSRSMELPFNGNAVVWDDHSKVYRSNIGRFVREPFDGKAASNSTEKPLNLIESETTTETTAETTQRLPPAATGAAIVQEKIQQQEGLPDALVLDLENLGVFKELYGYVAQTMKTRGLDLADVQGLIESLREKFGKERAAALFKSRLGNLKHKNPLGYTKSTIKTCKRCWKVFREDFMVVVEGFDVCLDCLTEEECTEYGIGEE